MKKIFKILFILFLFLFFSCDILRFSLFEVIEWSPGEGYHSEPENIILIFEFSREPDMTSVEKHFSLTADGNRVRGEFLWDGNKLTYTPLTPLEINTDYVITISQDAHDIKGLSMDEAFNGSFTTRASSTRPVLLSCYPGLYEEIEDRSVKVRLEFSIPVPVNTLYENVSFNPSIQGIWQQEDEGRTAVFCPSEPWSNNTRYEISVSSSLKDINGMSPGKDFTGIFFIGTDREAPCLISAHRITKNGDKIELLRDKGYAGVTEFPVENPDWEKEDKLYLVFSKPVDTLTLKNYLSVDDGPNLIMENTYSDYSNEFYFKFENIPLFESRFIIKVKPGVKDKNENESKEEYIYRIFANGEYSKPPVFVGFRMPLEELFFTGINDPFRLININETCYPSEESIQTWIELYFDTAKDAVIDVFSIMDFFYIETTNNVLTFSPKKVKVSDFSVSEPQEGMEMYYRAEITGTLINTVNNGSIYFTFSAGLKDSLGNKNENPQIIAVTK